MVITKAWVLTCGDLVGLGASRCEQEKRISGEGGVSPRGSGACGVPGKGLYRQEQKCWNSDPGALAGTTATPDFGAELQGPLDALFGIWDSFTLTEPENHTSMVLWQIGQQSCFLRLQCI